MQSNAMLSFAFVLALVSVTGCARSMETETPDGTGAQAEREVVGTWLDQDTGSRITIFRESGTVFMETVSADGNVETSEMAETSRPRGPRFDYVDGGGGYFIVNENNELRGWTPDGPFLTALPAD